MAEEQTEKVKFTKSARDARTSRVYAVGQEAELDAATAERFRNAGVLGEGGAAEDIPKEPTPVEEEASATGSGETPSGTEQHPSVKAGAKDKEEK